MDITGIDIGALAASLGAVVKSLLSDRKADNAKKGLDERMAILETRMLSNEKRLDDGDASFRSLDSKIDRNNELLNQLIGEVRAGRK